MFDIITVGEMLIDLTQTGVSAQEIPQYTAFPGGAPANVAVAAAKLGAKTAFIGKVGNDAFGRLLLDTVRQNGVNADGMVVSDAANTTLAVVSLQESGERSFAFYRKGFADTLLSEDEIDDSLLQSTHVLHFGSVSLTDEPSRAATLSAAKRAKSFGATVTYDPNYRGAANVPLTLTMNGQTATYQSLTNEGDNLNVYYEIPVMIHSACHVTFDLNGRESTAPTAQTVVYGETAKRPANPIASGYQFTGWFTDAACRNKYSFSSPVTGDLTLYAGWSALVDRVDIWTEASGVQGMAALMLR